MSKNNNSEIIRVRLSESFMIRAKCKFCLGSPDQYFMVRKPILWFNPRRVLDNFKWCKTFLQRLGDDYFLASSPKNYSTLSPFNHAPFYKSYNSKLHRTRGVNPIFDVIECMTCGCGRTTWAFSEKIIKNRPEIAFRKSKYSFPKKIDY